ncbi:MAG: hypothetical protein KDA79_15575 [Planctomycetaceae bacterium]|nr:hypothetical protein [Planctomycetaceae bacterium]
MLRSIVQIGVLTMLVTAGTGQSAQAQVWWTDGGRGVAPVSQDVIRQVSDERAPGRLAPVPARPVSASRANGPGHPGQQDPRSYPQLDASLYPGPQPNIPWQTGGTIITNQAFAPHEMTYPHEYRAMYPPYYYKATGGWVVTPWGVWSHDNWKLMGTEVHVKYKSKHSLFSKMKVPFVRR